MIAAVRKAQAHELDALARTFARAFYDDPVFAWMLPDDARRLTINERFFRLGLSRLWLRHDQTYVADGAVGAIAWEPPGAWKVGMGEQLRALPALVRTFGRHLPRVLATLATVEKDHPREPHYYLPVVGVDPAHQGRGIGSALMRPMLERCDAEGVPAYLEASSPHSLALYERHGFEIVRELRLGRGSPPVWPMWRSPA